MNTTRSMWPRDVTMGRYSILTLPILYLNRQLLPRESRDITKELCPDEHERISRLTNSILTNSKLSNSNLSNSNLSNSKLTNSKLSNSKLTNSKLTNSKLTNSRTYVAVMIHPTEVPSLFPTIDGVPKFGVVAEMSRSQEMSSSQKRVNLYGLQRFAVIETKPNQRVLAKLIGKEEKTFEDALEFDLTKIQRLSFLLSESSESRQRWIDQRRNSCKL